MRFVALTISILICFTGAFKLNAADSNIVTVPKVGITNLLAQRQEYKGKRVEVTGYYSGTFKSYALYESEATRSRARSLWIDPFRENPHYKQNIKGDRSNFRGNVRIIGTLDYEPNLGVGHMNGWKAQITNLELFDRRE